MPKDALKDLQPEIDKFKANLDEYLEHVTDEGRELFLALLAGTATPLQQSQVATMLALNIKQTVEARYAMLEAMLEMQELIAGKPSLN